jgi:hypothetical protein
MAKADKKTARSSIGYMKAKGFEHIKVLKPAVEPPRPIAAKIRAAVRSYYRDRASSK